GVAVKYLRGDDPTARARFVEEAQITAQLTHPNIVPVHTIGTDDAGAPFMTMKRVIGRTMTEMIDRAWRRVEQDRSRHSYELRRLIDILLRVMDGVSYSHSRGVLHRDLKPDNVMIGSHGEVLVMDWGLARPFTPQSTTPAASDAVTTTPLPGSGARTSSGRIAPGGPATRVGSSARQGRATRLVASDRRQQRALLTLDGQIVGTLPFMPPEQAAGEHDTLDERADVYALGAILYTILTGRPPFAGPQNDAMRQAVFNGAFARPRRVAGRRRVPRDLEAITLRAMAREPEDRYANVAAMQADILRWLNDEPVLARRPGRLDRLVHWLRRHRGLTATMMAVGLVLGASVISLLWLRYQSDMQRLHDQRMETEVRQRDDAMREEAERRSRLADIKRLAGETELDRLRLALGLELRGQADDAINEFRRRWAAATAQGIAHRDVVTGMRREEVERYAAALRDVIQNPDRATNPAALALDWFRLGLLLDVGLHDSIRAIPAYTHALELDPGLVSALSNRGSCWLAQGENQAALDDYNAAALIAPDDARVLTNRALARARLGDLRGALRDADRAVLIAPSTALCYLNRGAVHRDLGDYGSSIQDYTRVLELLPESYDGLVGRAQVLALTGHPTEAIGDYTRAIRARPDDYRPYQARALCYMALNRPQEMADDLTIALRIFPDNPAALTNRAIALDTLGRTADAMADYRRAIAIQAASWRAHVGLGMLQSRQGDRPAARASLRLALQYCDNDEARAAIQQRLDTIGND
ncbi:MAG: protein kinase, partial [Planctomycetota bacterium]